MAEINVTPIPDNRPKERIAPNVGQKRTPVPPVDSLFGNEDKAPTPKIVGKHKANVEAALAVMEGVYSLGQMGVLVSGHRKTAMQMAEGLDEVQRQNRQAFESSERLAQTIANLGNVSAIGMFVTANLMYLAPVVLSLREERKEAKDAKTKPQRQENTGTGEGALF